MNMETRAFLLDVAVMVPVLQKQNPKPNVLMDEDGADGFRDRTSPIVQLCCSFREGSEAERNTAKPLQLNFLTIVKITQEMTRRTLQETGEELRCASYRTYGLLTSSLSNYLNRAPERQIKRTLQDSVREGG